MQSCEALLQPLQMRNVTIRNRLMITAHVTNFAKDHCISPQHVAYYTERAKGGIGLMTVGFPSIHPTSRNTASEIDAFTDKVIPGLKTLSASIHNHGAKIFMQLGHSGRQQNGTWTGREVWAPSAIPCPLNLEMPKEMEVEDIDEIVQAHADAAVRARAGGMDGVEIHSGYGGYLLSSFLSPYMNRRTDDYGGSLDNRIRLAVRVIDAVRRAVGEDFVVGLQVQGHDYSPDGIEVAEAQAIARRLAALGKLDYMVVKASTYISGGQNIPDMQHPRALWLPLAEAIKEAVPTMRICAVGRLNDPLLANEVVREGRADIIAMTRQNISDPETSRKIAEGRLSDIRRCIACNQGCVDMLGRGTHITCVHNPAAGHEEELGTGTLRPAERPGRIVVVGGGPAGMKAAEVAARRGHKVTLIERRSEMGGQLRLAGSVEGRSDLLDSIGYMQRQLEALDVDVRLGRAADSAMIKSMKPDAVVVATGSKPVRRIIGNESIGVWDVPGLDGNNIMSAWDILENGVTPGDSVLVVDDGESSWKSISVAIQLSRQGRKVTYCTMLPYPGARLGAFTQQKLLERLFATNIEILPFTTVRAVRGDKVDTVVSGNKRTIDGIDTIVLAGWHEPVADLYFALKGLVPVVERIGDALASRTMLEAYHEGERVARRL